MSLNSLIKKYSVIIKYEGFLSDEIKLMIRNSNQPSILLYCNRL